MLAAWTHSAPCGTLTPALSRQAGEGVGEEREKGSEEMDARKWERERKPEDIDG
jgi:hypothetical protein